MYDMHGNAAEWCLDDYNRVYPSNEEDPLFQDSPMQRVVRGGSYATDADLCRSGARAKERSNASREDLGFRVVRDVPGVSIERSAPPI
jgi:formylglycine-generating enzyme required for sulfatase activity